jgi:predicted nuclease of predicted toxin-antitoxin system
MKLLADVNVSRHVVSRLKALGYDATRVSDIMSPRSSDNEIISEARQRGAVLLSHDQDFGAILAITGAVDPSFINLRVSYVDTERLAQAIAAVLRATEADLLAGSVVTLDDVGVRIHRLPLD